MFLRYCFILGRYKNDLAPENCFKKRPGVSNAFCVCGSISKGFFILVQLAVQNVHFTVLNVSDAKLRQ